MPRSPAHFLPLAALLCSLLALRPQLFSAPAAFAVETGEIDGAKFALARPTHWNQRVLLLAHGLREADRPLVADLFPDHLAYRTLLDEGWIVAKTSYRRNGIIVADAIADLDALRAYVAKKFGPPDRVLLEGESMGGLIVTLMAERDPAESPLYAGAIAIGAALQVREDNSHLGLSLQPQMPLIFLTNQSEFDGPRAYVTANVPRDNLNLRPLLFRVARDGHINVNQRERLVTLRSLNDWLDHGPPAAVAAKNGDFFDATVAPEPQSSRVIPHADGHGFDARVIEVSAVYGNVFIDAQPADFAAAGIAPMTRFQLTVHGQTYRVLYGHDFGNAKRGDWIAFPNADGFTWLARNNADAAATARLALGDTVTLRRYDEP